MDTRSLVLAALVVLATVPAPAAADNPIDGFVATDGESEDCLPLVEFLCGIRDGTVKRFTDSAAAFTDERTASDITDEIRTTFNTHAGAFETYANTLASPTTNASDVLEVTVEKDDSTSTVYLTTDVVNGTYENMSMVATTDRTVDETCVLENNAARNAPDEIDRFHDKFAEPNESVTKSYMSSMQTRYAGNVECSFMEASS